MDGTKAEVLRYLGYRGQEVPGDLDALIDECIALMRGIAVPRHTIRKFGILAGEDGVSVAGTGIILTGGDIGRHLSGCGQAALMAATLGVEADNLIRRWEPTDLTRSLILDACATQLIEEVCDGIERKICAEVAGSGHMAAWRYSPGYGDLPLEIQPRILAVLDAGKRIGLTCTENFILLPRKSVTAIIGLGKDIDKVPGGCDNCNLRNLCKFGKDVD